MLRKKGTLHVEQQRRYVIINEVNCRFLFAGNRIHVNALSRQSEEIHIIPGRARQLGSDATNRNKADRKRSDMTVGTGHQKTLPPTVPEEQKVFATSLARTPDLLHLAATKHCSLLPVSPEQVCALGGHLMCKGVWEM